MNNENKLPITTTDKIKPEIVGEKYTVMTQWGRKEVVNFATVNFTPAVVVEHEGKIFLLVSEICLVLLLREVMIR